LIVHELSVCQALLAQVAEIAADHGASAVKRITVEVGPLSGVEPDLLVRAFEFARVGGCAADAVLAIKAIEITVSCLTCGAQSQARPNRLICAACGAYRTRVVAGDELRLRGVELRVSERQPAATV
jgi:hydrogenase nickel incorporation protein HypA/HybF